MILSILCKGLAERALAGLAGLGQRLRRLMPALLEAFGAAAAASLHVSPFYPLPDDRAPGEPHPEAPCLEENDDRDDEVIR